MKTLLVPVDFSEDAMTAIEHAVEIANEVGLSIRLIHVKKKKQYYFGFSTSSEEQFPDGEIEMNLSTVVNKFRPGYKAGGSFDFVIRHGSIVHEILDESTKDEVYAILTGLQGNTSLRDYLVGSNAYRIVAGAHKPVFAVRTGMKVKTVKKILLPLDDTQKTRIKVPVVAALAELINAEIIILGITDSPYDQMQNKIKIYTEQTEEYFSKRNVKSRVINHVDPEVAKKIIEVSEQEDVDMLAFMSDMTDDMLGQMLSVTAKYILHQSKRPLLCVPISIKN